VFEIAPVLLKNEGRIAAGQKLPEKCRSDVRNEGPAVSRMRSFEQSRQRLFCKRYQMHDTQQDRTYDEPNKKLGCQ
jgi:hypothetical protein